MDGRSFDQFTKSVASAATRRGVIGGLVGAAATGLAGLLRLNRAVAQDTCRQLGDDCSDAGPSDTQCCANLTCLRTIHGVGKCVETVSASTQCPAGYDDCGPATCCKPNAVCVSPGTCRLGS